LVLVGILALEQTRAYAEAYAQLGELFCPIGITGPPVFVLLFTVALVLAALYFRPENDFLWWLNLTGLTSIAIGVFYNFHLYLLLMALNIILGLAYRRHLGMKHIWHWRGISVVFVGLVLGAVVGSFGLYSLAELFK